jgi:ABC-type glycerol-3-phosphate transport system substrate-binding protein
MNAPSPQTHRPWREDWIPALYELGRYHLKPIIVDGKKVPHPLENKLMLAGGIYYDTVWFYNKVIARRLGLEMPPHTWDEFKADCQKARDAGMEPIKLDEGYGNQLSQTLLQASVPSGELNKTITGAPGAKPFTDPMYQRLFALERELLDKYTMHGWQASQFPAAQGDFATGRGLFILCGTWLPGELAEVAVKDKAIFDLGCFSFPHFNDEPPGTSVIGPSGWLVLKDGSQREGAILLLQFMSHHHWGQAIALKDGNPVAFAGDPIPPALEDIHDDLSHMKRAVSDPVNAYAPNWLQYVYLQLHDDFIKADPGAPNYMTAARFLDKLEQATVKYRSEGGEAKWE